MDIKNLIKSLEKGICPAELNYSLTPDDNIDWEKVLYNTRYNTAKFYEDKFPEEVKSIPAFDKIIDIIVDKNKDNSPLKEIEERENV